MDELLAVASAHSIPLEGEVEALKSKNPVVVVEGLDATGEGAGEKRMRSALTALNSEPHQIVDHTK